MNKKDVYNKYRKQIKTNFNQHHKKKKSKQKEYQRKWYLKNKNKKGEQVKNYRKQHQTESQLYIQAWRDELIDFWGKTKTDNSTRKVIGNLAEDIAEEILKNKGYVLLKMRPNFPFDFLVKKNNEIFAVEVSTYPRRKFSPWLKSFLSFLDLKLICLFVRPNFKEYWMIIIPRNQKTINVPKRIVLEGGKKIPENIDINYP